MKSHEFAPSLTRPRLRCASELAPRRTPMPGRTLRLALMRYVPFFYSGIPSESTRSVCLHKLSACAVACANRSQCSDGRFIEEEACGWCNATSLRPDVRLDFLFTEEGCAIPGLYAKALHPIAKFPPAWLFLRSQPHFCSPALPRILPCRDDAVHTSPISSRLKGTLSAHANRQWSH